jgi:ferredoxin
MSTTEQTGEARISIVPGKCIGAGNCVEQAEDYFDQDDEAIVIVLNDRVPASDRARIRSAVNVCPVAAIVLTDSAVL